MEQINQRKYLALAVPFALSTWTQPLLGAVDTAVVGRLDSPVFIGGVAIGTVIFNTLYWLFGFLRVATTGFAAQSLGTGRREDAVCSWLRPLLMGALIGLTLAACQGPILRAALAVYKAEPGVAENAARYFNILIWGAPLVLVNYANLGWLMGRGHVRDVLTMQIGANVINILLDLLFVPVLHLAVPGVAAATLISQAAAFAFGLWRVCSRMGLAAVRAHLRRVWDAAAMKRMLAVNADFFIRTICLLTMTNVFMAKSSAMGADILAANAIIFQMQYLFGYLIDGMGNAASVFAGKFTGSGDRAAIIRARAIARFDLALLVLAQIALLLSARDALLRCYTDLPQVLELARTYVFYLVLFLVTMPPGLMDYGFFSGATHTGPIRDSSLVAVAVFLALVFTLIPLLGNHGLWLAFIGFCCGRTLYFHLAWPGLLARRFPDNAKPAETTP